MAPERVRERIWNLLATLYDTSVEHLRDATRAAFETRPAASSPVFARSEAAPARARKRRKAEPSDAAVRDAFFVE